MLQKAIACFQKAVRLDQLFAPAYAGLADAYGAIGVWGLLRPVEAFPKASDMVRKALEVDANLAEANASQAIVSMFYDWDWTDAAERLRRAIALKPGCALFHLWNGHYLSIVGRFAEAIDEVIKARDLDPLSPVVNANVGWTFILAGEYERAIRELDHVLELDPHNPMANFYLGYAFAPLGRYQEAISAFQKAQANGGMPWCDESVGWVYGLMKERKKAEAILRVSLKKIKQKVYVPWSMIAMIHVGLDDHESALNMLKRCLKTRDSFLPWVQYTPGLNQLIRNHRMRGILTRIGLQ